jgi:hypothetical protein
MASPADSEAVCGVRDERPCQAQPPHPLGARLLTVESRDQPARTPRRPLNTLNELFAAMSACWVPPPLEQSRPGTEITIRFSLTRQGDILGEPRFTYSTPTLSNEIKTSYQRSVAAMLKRCAPFNLSDGLGGAIAGRPISTRFIDTRDTKRRRDA